MFDEFKDRGVVVLAVNLGDSSEKIKGYFDKNKFTMQVVRQKDSEVSDAYGVQAYPTNYLIGADGKIAFRSVGFGEDGMRGALEKAAPKK